jgi:hypothetical protein
LEYMEKIESAHCKRVLLLLYAVLLYFQPLQNLIWSTWKIGSSQILLITGFAFLGIDRILHFSKRNSFPLTVPFYLVFISN